MPRKLFIFLAAVAVVLGSTAVGLRLSPYLAVRLGFAPFEQTSVEGKAVTRALLALVGNARTSVVLATEVIDSRSVLDALQAAGQRNVKVVVVLSGPSNTDRTKGARAWLLEHAIPSEVTVDAFRGTIMVVDKRFGVISASPVLSEGAFAADHSPLFVFDHAPTASTFFEHVKSWRAQ